MPETDPPSVVIVSPHVAFVSFVGIFIPEHFGTTASNDERVWNKHVGGIFLLQIMILAKWFSLGI